MPFAREEQEEVALLQVHLRYGATVEDTFTFDDIKQLIFRQDASFLQFKVIPVGMTSGRIGVVGSYFFIANRCRGDSPQGITVAGQHIFTCLHCFVEDYI